MAGSIASAFISGKSSLQKTEGSKMGRSKHAARKPRADTGDGCLRRRSKSNGKGGRIFYGNFAFQKRDASGKMISHNLGTSDRAEAEKRAKTIRGALQADEAWVVDGRILVGDYIRDWLGGKRRDTEQLGILKQSTLRRYQDRVAAIRRFLEQCGKLRLMVKDVNTEFFKEFQAWRLRQTRCNKENGVVITPEGVNQDLDLLAIIFRAAYQDRLIPKNPTKGVKPLPTEVKRIDLPTRGELEEVFLQLSDPMLVDYCHVVVATGMRSMEGQQLKFKHVDWERQFISIQPDPVSGWKPKNKNSVREIPLSAEVMDILKRIRDRRGSVSPEDYVFVLADGSPLVERPRHAYDRLNAACEKVNKLRRAAGKTELKVNVRQLRHWCSSWSINRTENPLQAIQLIAYLGHVDLEMLKRTYYHADIDGEGAERIRQTPLFGRQISLEAAPGRTIGAKHTANVPGVRAEAVGDAPPSHDDSGECREASVDSAEDMALPDLRPTARDDAGGEAFVGVGEGI